MKKKCCLMLILILLGRLLTSPVQASDPDSTFTYASYEEFLMKVSDKKKYKIVSLNKFEKTKNKKKIVIAIRHDVDSQLEKALDFAKIDYKHGITSSFYILHTASYYLKDPRIMGGHNETILPTLLKIQNQYHHEIGLHTDLIALKVIYHIDPETYLTKELLWLRSNGILITGTAAHGSTIAQVYKYVDYNIFQEIREKTKGSPYVVVQRDTIKLKSISMKEHGLLYEAYFLDNNKYYADYSNVNERLWHPDLLDLTTLKPGDRVIFLIHPEHYYDKKPQDQKLPLN